MLIFSLLKNVWFKTRQLFSADVIFLCFIILLCGLNFYFYTQENQVATNQRVSHSQAIVIGFNQLGFARQPIIMMENKLYFLESKSKLSLQVGQNIVIEGYFEPFLLDGSFDQYLLSIGMVGTVKVEKIHIYSDCNLNCYFFKNLNSLKFNYTKTYQSWFCHPDKKLLFSNLVECSDLAGLAVGLSIGGNQNLTDKTKQNFRDLGLTHLIAVSGFQVVLMLDIAAKFAEKSGLNFRIRQSLQIFMIVGLLLVVGLQAPVLRASISALINLLALSLGRKISTLKCLILAGIILIFWNPAMLLSLSFQLSFAATLGLVLLPNFNFNNSKGLNKTPNFVQEIINMFLTSLACTLWTLPLIVQINQKISAISVLANVIISPFISLSTILAFIGQIPILGELFLVINSAILILILNIIDLLSKINIFVFFEKFSWWENCLYYLFLLLILAFINIFNSKRVDLNSTDKSPNSLYS